MPLYELYRLTKAKLDSKEINSACATDRSSAPENDFFELVWENGQISKQGKSSRARKSPVYKSFQSHDKDAGYGSYTRMGKFGDLDSVGLNEIPLSVPSGEVDLSQDEDIIPWLNYTMDESLPHEYSSEFMRDLSGVTLNELPALNNFALMDKTSNCSQVYRDTNKNLAHDVSSSEQANLTKGSSAREIETTRPKGSTSQLYPPSSQQRQTSFASIRSKVSDITENHASNAIQQASCLETPHIPSTSGGFGSLIMQKQDPLLPSNNTNIMNFSHFARPAAIVRANLQSISLMSGLSSTRSESVGTKNKDVDATRSNPHESTLVESRGEKNCHLAMDPSKAELKESDLQPKSKSLEQKFVFAKQSDPACEEDNAFKNDYKISNQVLSESGSRGQPDAEKVTDPIVASSSICSGNGIKSSSDDQNQNLKRKSRDSEDSECHSEEVEEESVGIKKATPGRGGAGSNRSRAAEVHNLSERKRRDRINKKMRALQELIPNCNKVDKASMLDEAIEYLKTLQLQVQIMSMGPGLYTPPMMLHPGIQHMHGPHLASFSPVGVGGMQMGLGMGYGMNSGSSRFPMFQMPHMQGAHFPVLPLSGPNALHHGIARSNPQVLGFPGQGLTTPMPQAPVVSLSGGPLMSPSTPQLNAGSKDQMPKLDTQVTQCEAINGGFDQAALVQNSGHASNIKDRGAPNPGKEIKPV